MSALLDRQDDGDEVLQLSSEVEADLTGWAARGLTYYGMTAPALPRQRHGPAVHL